MLKQKGFFIKEIEYYDVEKGILDFFASYKGRMRTIINETREQNKKQKNVMIKSSQTIREMFCNSLFSFMRALSKLRIIKINYTRKR